MKKVLEFLKAVQVYYLATADVDQPRVRPFGTILLYNDRLYIQTGKSKAVSQQLLKNPKAEICGFENGSWLRISCELIEDDDVNVRKAMLDEYPNLRSMYNENDGNTQVFYMKNAVATFSSFTAESEEIKF